jgi:hypothetical protein
MRNKKGNEISKETKKKPRISAREEEDRRRTLFHQQV